MLDSFDTHSYVNYPIYQKVFISINFENFNLNLLSLARSEQSPGFIGARTHHKNPRVMKI